MAAVSLPYPEYECCVRLSPCSVTTAFVGVAVVVAVVVVVDYLCDVVAVDAGVN